MFIQYFGWEAGLALLFAVAGCAVRYNELYKQSFVKITWFITDSIIAMTLGYITYLELVIELKVSLIHSYLVCMIVGNLGSKALTLAKAIVYKKLEKYGLLQSTEIEKVLKDDKSNSSDTKK